MSGEHGSDGIISERAGRNFFGICFQYKFQHNNKQQSPDRYSSGRAWPEEFGAGDQGHMFGYATDETSELMPLSLLLSLLHVSLKFENGTCPWLSPDGVVSRFVIIGGPHSDAGLTGRKIIIDTFGGWGAHGGGAFSGKDPTPRTQERKVLKTAGYGHFGRDDPDSWEVKS
ncbi:hypothetical protein ACLB2K_060716 [Fragaria x ananassa]